ncbi:uncharacterized protein KD926_005016 [Aspergillus affinis]|uniref:uncharacterized protein n=1 Tax=Aspergillus affinis TaxID=1070780 RepID=UPI0022FDF210|nr:uncharacterized protein KD926_005016 [Aspergillus affinis]KAI9034922.1 hypothetical protein KD926_005016 [Aspergillus affinis]
MHRQRVRLYIPSTSDGPFSELEKVGDYAFHDRPASGSPPHLLPGNSLSSSDATLDSPSTILWYLDPSSWELAHAPYDGCLACGDDSLKFFVDTLQSWMKQWTSQGHCAFINRSLYSVNLPLPIQDAYTTLAAYQTKTSETKRMVLRIAKERASNLVHSQPPEPAAIVLDMAMHLARTQALVIYTTTCLFDGNINARAQAEHGIEVLLTWGYQLLQSASLDTYSAGSYDASQSRGGDSGEPTPFNLLSIGGDLNSIWHTWVFTESIRRTYLASVLLMTIYSTLKEGWSGCPGGIAFTGDGGLWDAPSAYAWGRVMRTVNNNKMGFVPIRSHKMGDVLVDRKYGDVDDFTHASLIAVMGLERVERWREGVN